MATEQVQEVLEEVTLAKMRVASFTENETLLDCELRAFIGTVEQLTVCEQNSNDFLGKGDMLGDLFDRIIKNEWNILTLVDTLPEDIDSAIAHRDEPRMRVASDGSLVENDIVEETVNTILAYKKNITDDITKFISYLLHTRDAVVLQGSTEINDLFADIVGLSQLNIAELNGIGADIARL